MQKSNNKKTRTSSRVYAIKQDLPIKGSIYQNSIGFILEKASQSFNFMHAVTPIKTLVYSWKHEFHEFELDAVTLKRAGAENWVTAPRAVSSASILITLLKLGKLLRKQWNCPPKKDILNINKNWKILIFSISQKNLSMPWSSMIDLK